MKLELEYKDDVEFFPTAQCYKMVEYVMEAYEIFTDLEVLTVTSGRDGEHSLGSKHYDDDALDFRVWGMRSHQRWAVVQYLNFKYGDLYDFVDEGSHIHGEYDPD